MESRKMAVSFRSLSAKIWSRRNHGLAAAAAHCKAPGRPQRERTRSGRGRPGRGLPARRRARAIGHDQDERYGAARRGTARHDVLLRKAARVPVPPCVEVCNLFFFLGHVLLTRCSLSLPLPLPDVPSAKVDTLMDKFDAIKSSGTVRARAVRSRPPPLAGGRARSHFPPRPH